MLVGAGGGEKGSLGVLFKEDYVVTIRRGYMIYRIDGWAG